MLPSPMGTPIQSTSVYTGTQQSSEARDTWCNVYINDPAGGGRCENFHIMSVGDKQAEELLFPENGIPLRQDPIDATQYEHAFARLRDNEKLVVREWAAIEGESLRLSDGTRSPSTGFNFDINRQLAAGGPFAQSEQAQISSLSEAIMKLPALQGDTLRVVEHSERQPSPWVSKIGVGDIVSNYPCFMSASTSDAYAKGTLIDGDLLDPDNTNTLVFYRIKGASNGCPLLKGVASPADEQEVLYPRNSCFKVLGIAVASSEEHVEGGLKRIGVMLQSMPYHCQAKNLFTGEHVQPIL